MFSTLDLDNRLTTLVAAVTLLASLTGWFVLALQGRRMVRQIGIDGLAVIALLAGLHVVVSYASRIGGYLLSAVLGPFSVFLAGIGNEGLTSLLLAVTIVLVPRPGTFLLSSLTVFLVNALFTGQFGVVDLLFVTISFVTAEVLLALFGLTVGGSLRAPASTSDISIVVRMALAIGIANMATLYAQYCVASVVYRLVFAGWYLAALALVTGLLYGGVGAGIGTILGYRLRKTAA